MIHVLFVCLGNICRSPMAEAVFAEQLREDGLDQQVRVDSAGTGGYHIGEQAHRGTRAVLERHDIPYDGRGRQFDRADFNRFDYILAMDRSNLAKIQQMAGQQTNAEIALFLSYANASGATTTQEVPDPYYDGNFDGVYDLVTAGCRALLAKIRADHDL